MKKESGASNNLALRHATFGIFGTGVDGLGFEPFTDNQTGSISFVGPCIVLRFTLIKHFYQLGRDSNIGVSILR